MCDVVAMRWEREGVASEVAYEHAGGGIEACCERRVPCVEGRQGQKVGAVEYVHAQKVCNG
jgi:hypothetical protein